MEDSPDVDPNMNSVPTITAKKKINENIPNTVKPAVVVKHEMTPKRIEALAKARHAKAQKKLQRQKDLKELELLRKQNISVKYHDLLSKGEIDTRFMTREDLDDRIAEIPKSLDKDEMIEIVEGLNLKISQLSEKLSKLAFGSEQEGGGTKNQKMEADIARKTIKANTPELSEMERFLKKTRQL